jgi:hypothetical protein
MDSANLKHSTRIEQTKNKLKMSTKNETQIQ